MANLNKVFLMGNLTRDPELKNTPQGTPVARIGLAVNEQYKTQAGEVKKKVDFFTVVAWGKTAENCSRFLLKGRPILVEGKLSTRSWEKDGQKHQVTEIVAERVTFLGTAPKTDGPANHSEPGEDFPQDALPGPDDRVLF